MSTAWLGRPAPERIGDERIWADFWTRYFTDREGRHCWVVQDCAPSRVIGYLTGTADVRRFDRYVPFLLPAFAGRVVRARLMRRRAARRALFGLLRSMVAGELRLPSGVAARFPATFHVNLLPEARRRGLGTRLFRTFAGRMRSLDVPGIHAQTLSVNDAIAGFCRRAGFRRIASRPLRAFAHVDAAPIDLVTWVLAL